MAMASQVPPKWCFGRDLSEMSWSLAKTVGTILKCALLNFLSQEKGKWFKKAFDGNNIRFGAFLKSFVKSSIIARISITDFSKPRFNFNSHWKFSKVFFLKPLNFAGDTILIVGKKIQGGFWNGVKKSDKVGKYQRSQTRKTTECVNTYCLLGGSRSEPMDRHVHIDFPSVQANETWNRWIKYES